MKVKILVRKIFIWWGSGGEGLLIFWEFKFLKLSEEKKVNGEMKYE